ncbi:TetR/AcrR family transcriptional regulator [Paramicrobacterium agarici]|uniref:TetR family transcriptional regulator n=1 Tax=Paramicrobacterium agarici TaxID=630514 RepID=A0A2A9DUP2_9MICO|nr:TetR/AcrR family transcriptional regulator [Microbacterium agarici]PFG29629.1 TetR family transcriptional regulator [Microbacterium agarici]
MFTEPVQSRVQQREATRRRVIDVADRLFRANGFTATSVRQIAHEAGVSAGTVMAVGDKSTLLAAVFESSIAQMQSAPPPRTSASADAATTPDRIAAVLRPFLELFARDQELSREYAGVLVRGGHESVIFTTLGNDLLQAITVELARSGLSAARAAAASRVIYFAYLGVLFAWAGNGSDVPSALRELRNAVSVVTAENPEN